MLYMSWINQWKLYPCELSVNIPKNFLDQTNLLLFKNIHLLYTLKNKPREEKGKNNKNYN